MPTGPTGPTGPPAYNIPWMWGNTWKKNHVNQQIAEDQQVEYRYAPPSPQHPQGTDGGQSFAGSPPYKDISDLARDPDLNLDAIMLNVWRVKTWKITYSFAMSGGINLFSHDYGVFPVPPELYTPWDIHFASEVKVGRQYKEYFQLNPALRPDIPNQPWDSFWAGPVTDERNLFGPLKPQPVTTFGGFPQKPFFGPNRRFPFSDDGFYKIISGPSTAGFSVPRFGITEDPGLGPLGTTLNWNSKNTKIIPAAGTGPATTGPDPRLEVMARYVGFAGDNLEMPFRFQDARYYRDPMDNNQIVYAGINTMGQANPAREIGVATMTIRVAVPASSGPTGPIPGSDSIIFTRKCYSTLSAMGNRGFYVNDGTTGSIAVEASEYFPFQTRSGLPVYDKDSGDQINDPFS